MNRNSELKIKRILQSDMACGDEKHLWFIPRIYPIIVELDRTTAKAKILMSFAEYRNEGFFRSLAYYENSIYIFSNNGFYLIYDMIKGKCIEKKIPAGIITTGVNNWCAAYKQYGDVIYFGYQSPVIVSFNLSTGTWYKYSKWKQELPQGLALSHWISKYSCEWRGKIYYCILRSKYIVEIDPDTKSEKVYRIDMPREYERIEGCINVCGEFYLICLDNYSYTIIKLDLETRDYNIIAEINANCINAYIDIIYNDHDKTLIFIPGNEKFTYMADLNNRRVQILDRIPSNKEDRLLDNWDFFKNYYGGVIIDGTYLAINAYGKFLLEIDLKSKKESIKVISDFESIYSGAIGILISNSNVVKETHYLDVEDLVDTLSKA